MNMESLFNPGDICTVYIPSRLGQHVSAAKRDRTSDIVDIICHDSEDVSRITITKTNVVSCTCNQGENCVSLPRDINVYSYNEIILDSFVRKSYSKLNKYSSESQAERYLESGQEDELLHPVKLANLTLSVVFCDTVTNLIHPR